MARRGAAAALIAGAASASAEPERPAEPATRQPDLVVTATREPRSAFGLPAAVDTIAAERIREARPQVNLSEALNDVPGVVVQNRHNYAQDLQVSLRGFGGRATFGVRGVRLIADGIPATMPDGQGQAATFDLATAGRIEVLRGPLASQYGNASGGVIQVFTADAPPRPTLDLATFAGSFDSAKAGLRYAGRHGEAELVSGASRFRTGGFREHSAARRDQANLRVAAPLAGGRLSVVASGLDQPQSQDPLGLTREQFASDPRQADAATRLFDTRKSVRQGQLGAVQEAEAGNFGRVQVRLYAGERSVLQFLPQSGDTPRGSGGVVDLDRRYGGAGLRWSRDLPGERPLSLTLGLERDAMDERRRGYVNDFGVPGALRRDEDDSVANADAYGLADWRFAPGWRAVAGARHSRVRFDVRDRYVTAANPDDSGSATYSRTTPAVGLAFEAGPALRLYANAGGGFETPTFAELAYRADGEAGPNLGLRPAVSRQAELGAKARLGEAGRVAVALFRIDTRDEIVVDASAGGRTTYRNAARTRRDGVEVAAQGSLGHGFEASAAWTWLDARFTQAFASGMPPVAVRAGSKLPGVPASVLQAGLAWRHASGLHLGAELRAAARVYVNDANTDAAPGHAVAGLRAGLERRCGAWRCAAFVRIDNVGDRAYAGSVIVAESRARYFEPAPGRAWLAGLTVSGAF